MDAEVDSAWICTQAVVSTDSQSDNEQEKINNYGCIFLNDMIDNGRYVLKEGDNTIGRHPLNHIYIDHPSVSMNHAVIQCDSDGVVLLDKGSLNKTKLNKKTLRKDVAYFLEENALLVFGEVRANYCMNEESNEFTNDTKSRAPHNTSVDEKTQNDGLSLSKLSNAAITPKSVSTDIPNVITDCNLSLVIENSSSCKIEKEVPKTVIGTECAMNTINDIHTQLNSSSPSDEYLLETLSQVEAKQNSNGIFHNLSNEDTTVMNLTESVPEITQEDCPSPVMDLKSSILTTSNVANNQFVSPNKINTEAMREDTPSPVMDLKNSIITTNNISTIMFQSPSQIKTKLNREDTPSPIMDLGCYDDFGNNLETINYGISAIQSPNKVDEFDNTQVLEIDNNIVELYTKTSNNDDILFYKAQKVKSSKQSNTQIQNSSDIQSNDNLSNSKNINLDTKCNEKPTKHFCRKNEIQNDNFNSDTSQNTSMLTSFRLITATDGHNNDEHKRIINTFEADDDEVFRNFIENECKSQQHDLAKLENQDFFNCPTQKISINKNRNIKSKLSSSVHDEETHKPPEFKQPNKMNTITSKIYTTSIQEENIQIPEIEDDFFNCPTQKLPITKKIQPEPKVPSSIYEEETQISLELKKLNKIDTITSKNYTTSIQEENIQIPEIEDDFFNCPTQKLPITKKIQPEPKVPSSIYEEETQIPLELKKLNKIDTITSKNYNTNIHEENTQIPEMDDDFFNCPTQKLSISKIIPPKPKVSSSIYEEETQIPLELKKLNKIDTITSKNYNTNIHEDNTQIPEMDDDFFNCPTQKLPITKKIQPEPKVPSSIYEEETQIPLELKKLNKIDTITSEDYNTNIHEENTQIPEIDDDFFNCPTQKVSISKIIPPKPKVSSSIHEEETQIPVELKKLNKIDTITSEDYNTNIHEENTQIPEIDDDFFNCPTQKVSISKIIPPKPKVSSSIHEEETQIPVELKKLNKIDTITSKNYNTNIQENNTQISEMDDDFFNCPTQKVSISKIIPPKPKVSSSIHEEETQIPVELKKLNKIDTITSKNYNTNIQEDNTQISEMDDDFFNCPTQKVSISKIIPPKPKVSSSIHEEETQIPVELKKLNKIDTITSKNYNTNIQEDNTQISEMDDDFFNCPTQKVSISKKIQPKPKVSSSIHEEETQIPLELKKLNKIDTITSKNYNTNIQEENTQIPEMDDDFFNCPTQKLSISKKIQPKPKVSSSIHEEETQIPVELKKLNKIDTITSKNYNTNIHEENTQIPEMDDDFFNCPTQKVSISKKIQPKPKVSSSIYEEETQIPLELKKLNKIDTITSKNYNTNIHEENTQIPEMDDDFFNCPTQKVSISKIIQPKPKASSSIHEEETQIPVELKKLNKIDTITSKNYNTNIHEENTQIPEMDDDFFNCPTQKVSISKIIQPKPKASSSIHEEETQIPVELKKLNKIDTITSKNYNTNIHEENTQIPEMDDDFFNCPTQKLSISKKIQPILKVSSSIHEEETQKPLEFSQFDKTNYITSNTINIQQNKGNIVNCTTQKCQSNSISNCSINIDEDVTMNPEYFDVSNNHKQIVEPVKEDRCKVQKSKCVKSTIKLSNVQLPVNCNEKSSNSLKINKPKIRVREDLHMSCSGDSSNNFPNILNKPNENAVSNNINTTVPFDKNFDSPGCSNTTTIKKNDLNASSSTKQKHFTDDSVQSQVTVSLKYKHQMKRMDESIFSPLNIPDVSANSLLEHHSSPKTTENKLNTLNCEPSTSCNDAIKWKSFWNKKKVQSQGKGISDKQKSIKFATEVKENKERYQTRAITRKRKQNGVVESNKKICSRNKILEPLVENSSEIVVSFSYLKSRHLQEMKQFVDQTGGTVTDEITQCSVLVTDKIRCTMKILSAIARGCPIVNVNWLKHSYTVKMFQDFDDFIIVDKDAERKYKFQLKESLAKAKAKRLLDGYNVLVTPSVKPGPQEMKVIITCAGGNYVLNWTTKQYSKELIVTCDKDRTRWKSAWDNEFAKIIDSDTLVMSIIRQKLTI